MPPAQNQHHIALYRAACAQHPDVPLHLQPWWLDAVCGSQNWQACVAADGAGRAQGIMPYLMRRRLGLPVVQLPPFTSYAGPWLFYPQYIDFKAFKKNDFEKKVLEALITQLPPVAYFQQNFSPGFQNGLYFQWAGYRETTRYTYQIRQVKKVPELNDRLFSETRRRISRAAEAYSVHIEHQPNLLWDFYADTCKRRNIRPNGDRDTLLRLCLALHERNQCDIFLARERKTRQPVAALLLAHHKGQSQHLVSGQKAGEKTGYLNYLLLYQALRHSIEHGRNFDFEGSMDEGLARVFRAFGGELVPYSSLKKIGHLGSKKLIITELKCDN